MITRLRAFSCWAAATTLLLLPHAEGRSSTSVRQTPTGRTFHIGTDGRATNAGTAEEPWDLGSALAGEHEIRAGDTLWVHGGTYKGKFEVKLQGAEKQPIQVRVPPGERATILDSGLRVMPPTNYVWIWDLEIAGSVPVERRETKQTGSFPTDLPGTDGLNIYAGKGCKFIHLTIHDNAGNGVGWWLDSTDSEMYGCLLYNNGWRAPDRGHGHAIYTQNRDGVKTIANCILSTTFDGSYSMHAYGSSRAFISNYLMESNVAFGKGPFLVGGGSPSHGIRVLNNYVYGTDMRIGYGAENEDCEVRGNVIANGKLSIEKFKKVVNEGNDEKLPDRRVVLLPSKYDPLRAHVVVYNGAKAEKVALDSGMLLKPGQRYKLLKATDLYGKPVMEGVYRGRLDVPVEGEFGAYVLCIVPPGAKS